MPKCTLFSTRYRVTAAVCWIISREPWGSASRSRLDKIRRCARVTWINPGWQRFHGDVAEIFSQIQGFSPVSKGDDIGRRHDSFATVDEKPINVIVEVVQFNRRCLNDCEAWLLAHVDEIEIHASTAFPHGANYPSLPSTDRTSGLRRWCHCENRWIR